MSERRPLTADGRRSPDWLQYGIVGAILLLYLVTGSLYAIYTPDWQAPDEPAHYNYIRQLAEGRLPVIEAADYDQAYIEQVLDSGFDPQYSLESFRYEDWQPPLYYLLQTPIYLLADGSLVALRLFSVLLGGGVVWLAYLVAQQLFPARPWLALGVAIFVAFLPQHLAILASVNNDSLAELLIAGILLSLVQMVAVPRFGSVRDHNLAKDVFLVGLLLGLGFLTKGTVYLMAPVVGFALLTRYWKQWKALLKALLLAFVPAFMLGALWWGRNLMVYDGLDILGKAAHDAVVVGQPRTAEWLAQHGLAGTIGRFLQTTFTSFWGQFGWMALPLRGWTFQIVLVLSLLALLGLLLSRGELETRDYGSTLPRRLGDWETGRLETGDREIGRLKGQGSLGTWLPVGRRWSAVILLLTFILTMGLHIWYNLTFVQHQGRYLFPALIPIATGVVVGLAFWLRLLTRRWTAAGYLLPFGLALILLPLAWYSLFRIIVPGL